MSINIAGLILYCKLEESIHNCLRTPKSRNRVGETLNNLKMKKSIFFGSGIFLIVCTIVVLFSCSKTKSSFVKQNATTKPANNLDAIAMINGGGTGGCPEGQHAELHYEFNGFNFHRPVKSCASGFWFCFINGHWETKCVQNSATSLAHIDGDDAYLWGVVTSAEKFEMHFPDDLLEDSNYTEEDLENLNVDDAWEICVDNNNVHYTLVPGTYAVSHVGSELIATVDLTEN